MDDLAQAAQTIAGFLQRFTASGGLRLRYRVKLRGGQVGNASATDSNAATAAEPGGSQGLYVEFSGPDTAVLTARNGELLNALEHVATKILRLDPEEHDRVSFDADHFKADRDRELHDSAAAAVERVRITARPSSFPAMSSRERRTLHLILSESGLPTASSGEGPGRFVVLYPAGVGPAVSMIAQQPVRELDASRVRQNFRHR